MVRDSEHEVLLSELSSFAQSARELTGRRCGVNHAE